MDGNIKDKANLFLFFDLNCLFRFAEPLSKKGYYGNFPTAKDREFETDRQAAKQFCKENYPDLEVAPVHEFKTLEEAKQFLEDEEEENIYVIKGKSDNGPTICPDTNDFELAKEQILNALDKNKKDYESSGFILEKKIIDPIEITPQAIFYDGKLVCTDLDIENKPLGSGNLGPQTGCSACLVFPTQDNAQINKIAFPEAVQKLASEHKGMFIWDVGILIDPATNIMYMSEYCSNRLGWDSIFAEFTLANGIDKFFDDICHQKNPFRDCMDMFAGNVRMFDLPEKFYDSDDESVIKLKNENNIYLYNCYKKGDDIMTSGYATDVGVCCGKGVNIEECANDIFEAVDNFGMEGIYYRPKFDFLSPRYKSSIVNRYKYTKHLYELPS